ncbi:MAG: ubiquinol-cytochrome c reductase iron-sulfur subunit [Desulfobacteraceae bacterium]|nr:ubiquinol-cytochrome c reductase iron-sulfur subunit [Desulfobacteraceae bacterium]
MTRRDWIKKAGKWGLMSLFMYPLYAFIVNVRVRPPEEVRVSTIPKGNEPVIEPQFALFETAKGPIAVSRQCTHLGCTINYKGHEKGFLCPCHQSHFSWDGRYISGPAKKDLPRFAVKRLEGGKGYIVEIPRGLP